MLSHLIISVQVIHLQICFALYEDVYYFALGDCFFYSKFELTNIPAEQFTSHAVYNKYNNPHFGIWHENILGSVEIVLLLRNTHSGCRNHNHATDQG